MGSFDVLEKDIWMVLNVEVNYLKPWLYVLL